MKRIIRAAAMLAALLAATPAAASLFDFQLCDGYPAPGGQTDGLQVPWFGNVYDPNAPLSVNADEHAIVACDRALADPLLLDQYRLRRALLLRAKAVHQLVLLRYADGLATLALSDAAAAAAPDAPFLRQFGMGNHLLRAYADYRLKRGDAAQAELAAADKAPAYPAILLQMIYAMRLKNAHDWPQLRTAMMARSLTQPEVLGTLFWTAVSYGDFAEAIRIRPQLGFALPRGRDEGQIVGFRDSKYDFIADRAEFDGGYAYALAAMGQGEAARAAIAKARQDLADAARAPAEAPRSSRERSERDLQADSGRRGSAKLDLWAAAIALRAEAPGLTLATLQARVEERGLSQLPAVLDLIAQLKPGTPEEQAAVQGVRAASLQQLDRALHEKDEFEFDILARNLPRPNVVLGAGPKPAGGGVLFADTNGFYLKREQGSPYLNVRYGQVIAAKSPVEDLGLFAAASYARAAGKDSFLIDARMFINRTIDVIRDLGEDMTVGNGYEVRLRILPVNAAELTETQEPMRWRLIRVQDVVDQLGPLYPPPLSRKR